MMMGLRAATAASSKGPEYGGAQGPGGPLRRGWGEARSDVPEPALQPADGDHVALRQVALGRGGRGGQLAGKLGVSADRVGGCPEPERLEELEHLPGAFGQLELEGDPRRRRVDHTGRE